MVSKQYELHIKPDDGLLIMRSPALGSRFEDTNERVTLVASGSDGVWTKFSLKVGDNNYSSTKETTDDQLMVCQAVGDKLVCRPITGIHDMRADFTHLDVNEVVETEPEIRMVNIKFASAEHPKTAESEEDRVESRDLAYRPVKSKEAKSQRLLLFGGPTIKQDPDIKKDPDTVKPTVTIKKEKDFKPKVFKPNLAQAGIKKSNQTKQLVENCLKRAKIASFDEVKQFLALQSEYPSDKEIIEALTEVAVIVQGNWAVKSEKLYGDSGERSGTDVTGISIKLFTAARDYLLCLFNQDRLISRTKFSKTVRMPDHDILELFNQFAVFRREIKKWELKLPTDSNFIDKFPDVVQRQETIWKVRRANKLSIFGAQ